LTFFKLYFLPKVASHNWTTLKSLHYTVVAPPTADIKLMDR